LPAPPNADPAAANADEAPAVSPFSAEPIPPPFSATSLSSPAFAPSVADAIFAPNALTSVGSAPAADFADAVKLFTDEAAAVTNCANGFGGSAILVIFSCYTLFILEKMCYYITTRGLIINDINNATTENKVPNKQRFIKRNTP
jgi:hypothetical protein